MQSRRNHHIGTGDLFLFWGLFQKAEEPPFHAIWGYMQVEKTVKDPDEIQKYWWHPHGSGHYRNQAKNTLYVGAKHLAGIAGPASLPGYGVFEFDENTRPLLKLPRENDTCLTHWRPDALPWPDWENRKANMTYHPDRNEKRYFIGSRSRGYFQAANRGQEFIVDQVDARTLQWLANLLRCRNSN